MLEFGISNFLVRNIKEKSTFDQAMSKVEKWNATTMGALVRGLKTQEHWPDGLVDDLEAAVELRNWLTHHFLIEYFVVTPSPDNAERVVSYLDSKLEEIESLDARLDEHLKSLGVPSIDDLDDVTLNLLESLRPKDWSP